jgi:hypothetical protein
MKRKLLLAGALIVALVLTFFGPGDDEPAVPITRPPANITICDT